MRISKAQSLSISSIITTVLCMACADSAAMSDKLVLSDTSNGKTRVLELVTAPTSGAENAFPLAEVLLTRDVSEQVNYATDATLLDGGGFAVLDRIEPRIAVFSAGGEFQTFRGRRGRGPHELNSPVALDALPGGFVVLEPSEHPTLLWISDTVSARSESDDIPDASVQGSFQYIRGRGPLTFYTTTVSEGFEDPSRRMRVDEDANIFLEAQADPRSSAAGLVSIVRLSRLSEPKVVDTLLTLRSALQEFDNGQSKDSIHVRRAYWAVGKNWFASAPVDSDLVKVQLGDSILEIRWPRYQVPISSNDKMQTAQWLANYTIIFDKSARTNVTDMPPAEMERQIRVFADMLNFATTRAPLGGLIGSTKCVFIAGWNAKESRDGTSQNWLAVPVRNPSAVVQLRLKFADSRLRDVKYGKMLVTRLDSLGKTIVDVYKSPSACD